MNVKNESRKLELKSGIYFDKDVIICGTLFGISAGSYVISQIYYNNLRIDSYLIGVLYCLGNILTLFLNKLKFNEERNEA